MNIKNIRLFLLSLGFRPVDDNGICYLLNIGKTQFTTNLSMNKLFARFPDREYNKVNPYGEKDKVVDFDLASCVNSDDIELFIKQFSEGA